MNKENLSYDLPKPIIGARFLTVVKELIREAEACIEIIVFDWRLPMDGVQDPVADLLLALQEAKTRGVAVRVLVSNEAIGARLKQRGFEVQMVYTKKLMHCKLMLIDKCFAVIGSHNYTISAFTQNMEASIAMELPTSDNELALYFKTLWGV